jgi:hypothetical protein
MCSKTEILPRLFGILARKAGGKRAGSWCANEKILLGVSNSSSWEIGTEAPENLPNWATTFFASDLRARGNR